MMINPLLAQPPPALTKPQQPSNPLAAYQAQASVMASTQTAQTTRTQTNQAPAAVGKVDQSRKTMTGTDTPQSTDTLAQTISTKSQQRGGMVDIRA